MLQDMAIILQELTANTPRKKARDLMGTNFMRIVTTEGSSTLNDCC